MVSLAIFKINYFGRTIMDSCSRLNRFRNNHLQLILLKMITYKKSKNEFN